MQIFSPSATQTHSRCPVLWKLSRDGWRSKVLGKREIAAFLGRGIGAGLGTYYNLVKATGKPCPDPIASSEIAERIVRQSFLDAREAGAAVADYEAEAAVAAPAKARQAILSYAKWDREERAVPHTWKILDVERSFPDFGYARIDLGVDDGEGPAVLDWKSKGYLKMDYLPREIARLDGHGQMHHYSWAYGRSFGLPFLPRYYIGFVILAPSFRVEIVPYSIDEESHKAWLQSSLVRWKDMEAEKKGERRPPMATEHADNFGDCEFHRACPTSADSFRWDEALMATTYYRQEKKEDLWTSPSLS